MYPRVNARHKIRCLCERGVRLTRTVEKRVPIYYNVVYTYIYGERPTGDGCILPGIYGIDAAVKIRIVICSSGCAPQRHTQTQMGGGSRWRGHRETSPIILKLQPKNYWHTRVSTIYIGSSQHAIYMQQ